MIPRILADVVVALHLGFVAFVITGGFLALRWPRMAWLHLPVAAWGASIEFLGGICPLTILENRLRWAAGQAGYSGSFVEHYLTPILYPPGLTRTHQVLLGAGVLLLNVVLYARYYVRHVAPTRRGGPDGGDV
ncbi:MAG: DUF2784 domain-containing protein [Gemmatimonadota bacterium]